MNSFNKEKADLQKYRLTKKGIIYLKKRPMAKCPRKMLKEHEKRKKHNI